MQVAQDPMVSSDLLPGTAGARSAPLLVDSQGHFHNTVAPAVIGTEDLEI